MKSMGNFIFALFQTVGRSLENPLDGSTSSSRISSAPLHSRLIPTLSIVNRRTAHSAIMGVVFVILFPSFALTLYIIPSSKTVPRIHAPLQILTLGLAIAGFYFGVTLAMALGLSSAYHPITGYVVISCLILFQPAMGLLQHLHYRKTGERGVFAYAHRWLGRALLALGIINGGLGLRMARGDGNGAPMAVFVAYGVVAGVMGALYIASVIVGSAKKRSWS